MANTASVSAVRDTVSRGSVERASASLLNAQVLLLLNDVFTASGAATATTTTKAKTVNTLTYQIGGVFKSKGATDNFWTLSGTTVAASSWQKYLLLIDGSGAASVQEGVQSTVSAASVGWTNVSVASAWAPLISILNGGKAIVAVLTIATDSSHTFTPGTTALNATGITATFTDGFDPSLLPCIGNEGAAIIGVGV